MQNRISLMAFPSLHMDLYLCILNVWHPVLYDFLVIELNPATPS